MPSFAKIGLLTTLLAAGAAYQATSDTNAHETQHDIACLIEASTSAGTTTLTGIVRGAPGESGQYRLSISGGDGRSSTRTSQGGAFSIAPNGEAQTGVVRLSSGGVYEADMQISKGGETHTCSTRIGDRI